MSEKEETKEIPVANEGDESEEDEDYVPEDEGDGDAAGGTTAASASASAAASLSQQSSIPTLSYHKQSQVDDAFADLFGKPYIAPSSSSSKQANKKKTPKSKKAMKKKKRILTEIFGGSSLASKVMNSASDVVENDLAVRRQRKEGSLQQVVKTEVKEMKKFAGQMVEVTRSVVGGTGSASTNIGAGVGAGAGAGASVDDATKTSNNAAISTVGNNKPAGIDAVLSQINGPQKITTIDKTNMDWDSFKDKSGLDEELKKKAEGKDAYLVKKDFLNRVDARRFEQEKAERERKRSAAAASNIK